MEARGCILKQSFFALLHRNTYKLSRHLVPAVGPDFMYNFNKLAECPMNYPEQQTE